MQRHLNSAERGDRVPLSLSPSAGEGGREKDWPRPPRELNGMMGGIDGARRLAY